MANNDPAFADVLHEGRLVEEGAGHPVRFRDAETAAAVTALVDKRSVLLAGPTGVGKSTVLSTVAGQLAQRGQTVREFSVSQIMAGTRYIGEWQTKLTTLMTQAEASGTIIFLSDVFNLPTAGVSSTRGDSFLDAMRPWLASRRLQLIGEVTDNQLLAMMRHQRMNGLFDVVSIAPLSSDQERDILHEGAQCLGLNLAPGTLARIISVCETFSQGVAGPGTKLELLERIYKYHAQQFSIDLISPEHVDEVFAVYSGLPGFIVSMNERKSASEIKNWFRERLIGQEGAIDAVVEMIALYKARLHDKTKPIGSFLFVGPTGVGKTEMARTLAAFFFGSERRLLRFDMSEFTEWSSTEALVGSLNRTDQPARLIDPIRQQPFQIVLFDEIEKGHRNVQDLLLQVLDEGRLTTPHGETVSLRNAIVIATSNAGAAEGLSTAIGFSGRNGPAYDRDKAMRAVESQFRPEFINRFQHIVLFDPLTQEQATRIAEVEVKSMLQRDGIIKRNLIIDVDSSAIRHVLASGFNARYGARAIKREVKRHIILPIANLLTERDVVPGSLVRVSCLDGRIAVRVSDTPDSARIKAETRPFRTGTGKRLTRKGLMTRLEQANAAATRLAEEVDIHKLQNAIAEIDDTRKDYRFWHEPEGASQTLAAQTRLIEACSRVERLCDWARELTASLKPEAVASDLQRIAHDLAALEVTLDVTRRELVFMGPDGYWDTLLEIAPVGRPGEARDLLFQVICDWANFRDLTVDMLREPIRPDEPVMIAVRGSFTYGYLQSEAGLHKVKRGRNSSVVRLSVAPWRGSSRHVELADQLALKTQGQYGGKIRSRIELAGGRLTLQNARSLNENRELMESIARSWTEAATIDAIEIRRYELEPFLCRDYLTETDYSRADILQPNRFHDLLCGRVERLQGVTP